MSRQLPPSASVAVPATGSKLCAPSATRNTQALVELLSNHAPASGRALELASGTGQHVLAFAQAFSEIEWEPSDPDPQRRASIEAYRVEADQKNMLPPVSLDATAVGWGAAQAPRDLIVLVNLLHLIPAYQVQDLIREAAQALSPLGVLILYGPFKRSGQLTSEGDVRFDADLRSADPDIGYKDDLDVALWLGDGGLRLRRIQEMPSNNLAFVAIKP